MFESCDFRIRLRRALLAILHEVREDENELAAQRRLDDLHHLPEDLEQRCATRIKSQQSERGLDSVRRAQAGFQMGVAQIRVALVAASYRCRRPRAPASGIERARAWAAACQRATPRPRAPASPPTTPLRPTALLEPCR